MTETMTSNAAAVRAGYDAFARGDMAALSRLFHPDATWTHRNAGRFAGTKGGFETIAAFFGESAQLSAGTLRVELDEVAGDGDTVAALCHMTATRPDGRALDDRQCTSSACATASPCRSTSTSATPPPWRRSGRRPEPDPPVRVRPAAAFGGRLR